MAIRIREDSSDLPMNGEINVTPFIDVMLVLLIIFMVAAPLATVDVKVDLPVSTAQPAPKPDSPTFLSITADGRMLVNETVVAKGGIATAVRTATRDNRDERIYLRADKTVTYDRIMDAMNELRASGYLHVALVGEEAGSLA